MNKLTLGISVVGFVLALVFTGKVAANEGRLVLKNNSVTCEGISVWREERYRIIGRCSGLVYPYQEKLSRYLLWGQTGGDAPPVIVDNIEVGFFEGLVDKAFSQVFITAEQSSSPRQPSGFVIATGNVQPFDFAPSSQTESPPELPIVSRPAPTPTPTASPSGLSINRVLVTVPVVLLALGLVVVGIVVLSKRG